MDKTNIFHVLVSSYVTYSMDLEGMSQNTIVYFLILRTFKNEIIKGLASILRLIDWKKNRAQN